MGDFLAPSPFATRRGLSHRERGTSESTATLNQLTLAAAPTTHDYLPSEIKLRKCAVGDLILNKYGT